MGGSEVLQASGQSISKKVPLGRGRQSTRNNFVRESRLKQSQIKALPNHKQDCPVLLGEELDTAVKAQELKNAKYLNTNV